MKWGSWLNLIVGIWLLISPAIYHLSGAELSNNMAFGVLAIIVAIWSLIAMPQNHVPAWINLAFGIWVFISPWALAIVGGPAVWNNAVCGVLLVIFAIVRMSRVNVPARTV